MRNRIASYLLIGTMLISLPGCTNKESVQENTPVIEQTTAQGDDFLSGGFKIKSTITPQNVSTLDQMVFEVYVDSSGNGSGLVGYKDGVYDVIIVNDALYVKVSSDVVVQLNDVTGHLIPADLRLTGAINLEQKGFTLSGDKVVAYKANNSSMIIESSYQSSDVEFDKAAVVQGNTMTVSELIRYILEAESTGNTYIEGDQHSSDGKEKESFYNNSWLGVKIHGQTYSLGDYCNPATYFEGSKPEGITISYAWNKDTKIELLHPSYISSDGRTVFMTTDGYVQSISTTCPFEFLGIEYGITETELKALLGIGLRKADLETWKPIVEGLTAEKGKSGTYVCTYEDITITFSISTKTKQCNGIAITQYIDFVEG